MWGTDKQNVVYLSLPHNKKAQTTNTRNNTDEPQKHCTKGKKPDKTMYCMTLHL